jgi:hypothetical protein
MEMQKRKISDEELKEILNLKEELTEEMHSEFFISKDNEMRYNVWNGIAVARLLGLSIEYIFHPSRSIATIEDYYKYKDEMPDYWGKHEVDS